MVELKCESGLELEVKRSGGDYLVVAGHYLVQNEGAIRSRCEVDLGFEQVELSVIGAAPTLVRRTPPTVFLGVVPREGASAMVEIDVLDPGIGIGAVDVLTSKELSGCSASLSGAGARRVLTVAVDGHGSPGIVRGVVSISVTGHPSQTQVTVPFMGFRRTGEQ